MQPWSLFLDDERFPIDETCAIARTVSEAKSLVEKYGTPWHLDLDHDLGENSLPATDFLTWMIDRSLDGNTFPSSIKIHSQNPIGRKNLEFDVRNAHKHFHRNLEYRTPLES